jgi:hypothetical protein
LPWPFSSSPVANCSKNSCLRTQHLTQHGHPGKPSWSRTPSSRVAQAPASDARWIPSLMRVCLHRSPPRSPMSAGRGSWLLAHVDQHTLQHTRVRLTVLRLVHSLLGALVAPDVVRDVPQLAESLPPWWHSWSHVAPFMPASSLSAGTPSAASQARNAAPAPLASVTPSAAAAAVVPLCRRFHEHRGGLEPVIPSMASVAVVSSPPDHVDALVPTQ